MENIIIISDLCKDFKSHKRKAGFGEATKSLFIRKYETTNALKNINLEVKRGEILGLIGPNGAGKSTLIKILTGVLFPTSGAVDVMGFVPWEERIRYVKHIGVVFGQKSQLWWDIPAADTFELHSELYDIPKREFAERLNYMVDSLEIGEIIKKPVRQLSLGERMRCELVLALLHKPKIVFLDEPTIGLDIIAKDKIRDFIEEFNKRYSTTFIITTHDMSDIEKLCKHVVIVNHGEIVYNGLLERIKDNFASKKVIDCRFSNMISNKKFSMKGCSIIKKNKYQLILEVDLKKSKVKNVIDYLITNYKVSWEDIIIEDPPIEEIIKLVYRKKV